LAIFQYSLPKLGNVNVFKLLIDTNVTNRVMEFLLVVTLFVFMQHYTFRGGFLKGYSKSMRRNDHESRIKVDAMSKSATVHSTAQASTSRISSGERSIGKLSGDSA
jgi:hypothetical protein